MVFPNCSRVEKVKTHRGKEHSRSSPVEPIHPWLRTASRILHCSQNFQLISLTQWKPSEPVTGGHSGAPFICVILVSAERRWMCHWWHTQWTKLAFSTPTSHKGQDQGSRLCLHGRTILTGLVPFMNLFSLIVQKLKLSNYHKICLRPVLPVGCSAEAQEAMKKSSYSLRYPAEEVWWFIWSIWSDLQSPWKHIFGCVYEGVVRKV